MLEEYQVGSHFLFKKNANYYDADSVKLAGVKAVIITDDNTAYQAYQAGEVDVLDHLPSEQIPQIVAEDPNVIVSADTGARFMNFNVDKAPTDNLHVRKAISYASLNPRMTVSDIIGEPISALDVSIQAQVVNMLEDLQASLGLTYLFIAHDLSMVRHISKKVGVMYLGSLVEFAETEELYTHTLHPYTKALLSAVPELDPAISKTKKVQMLTGEIPSPINTPPGCKFATRCPHATPRCKEERPEFKEVCPGHYAACHLV